MFSARAPVSSATFSDQRWLLWFAVIGVLSLFGVFRAPAILAALSPFNALRYLIHAEPAIGFAVLGAAFLAVTGGEAMNADMGHFGRPPIRLRWFAIVLPCLVLNYFGQGALLLSDPSAIANPFYLRLDRRGTPFLRICNMVTQYWAARSRIGVSSLSKAQ